MSVIFAMCLFALSMSISPGPVNLITLSSGINYGFKNSLPFVSGATVGFNLLLLIMGLGLGAVAAQNQLFLELLSYGGTGFICYLGYKIATSEPKIELSKEALPTFYQGVVLQWLNPKAWVASLAGVSAFNLADSYTTLILFVSLYFVICYLSVASWALAGSKISGFFNSPENLRIFNIVMGGVLVLVAFYLLLMQRGYIAT